MRRKKSLLPGSSGILSLITIVFLLALWHGVTASGMVRPIFLPSPAAVGRALMELLAGGRFFQALLVSFARVAGATCIAVIIGALIGVLMGVSRKAYYLLSPVTQPLRYLPITALIPLLVLWFGIGEVMKIIFLVVGIVFYFIPLVQSAIRTASQEHIDVARSFGASRLSIVRRVHWRHALPRIFDGLIVINGIGWTYVILAEIINARDGLGYLINIAGRLQRTDEVFAGLALIALVAMLSDRLLHRVRDRYFFW